MCVVVVSVIHTLFLLSVMCDVVCVCVCVCGDVCLICVCVLAVCYAVLVCSINILCVKSIFHVFGQACVL